MLFVGSHPFRWQWNNESNFTKCLRTTDTVNWKNYSDNVNIQIEEAYKQWKFSNGPNEFTTSSPIVRFVGDQPQLYTIKFDDIPAIATTAQITGVQTNTKSKFKRAIRRSTVNDSSCRISSMNKV